MKRIKSPGSRILLSAVMFLAFSVAVFAQDSLRMQMPSSTARGDSTRISSPSSASSQDLSFNTQAAKLSNELVQLTGLSTDKAVKITEVLKDYRNDIAEARSKYYEDHPKSNTDQNATGSSTASVNMSGILGDNVEQYYAGASPDLMSDYKDADKKADNNIKDIFDNDVQTSRYEQNKGQWWRDVKEQVFSSLKQKQQDSNSQYQTK